MAAAVAVGESDNMAVDTVIESECKYETPAGVAFPEPADLVGAAGVVRVGPVRTHELTATYFDTDDLRLARRHITLRRRTGGTGDRDADRDRDRDHR